MSDQMIQRMIRAAQLDVQLYEEVEADTSLTQEAITVVVLVAALNALGLLIGGLFGGRIGFAILGALVYGIWAVLGFFVWAWLAYFIGTRVFAGTADVGELIRTLGYAYTPNVLGVFRFIPCLGALIGLAGSIWALVAMVIAIRQALDFDTGKAILTVILGFIVYLVVAFIIAAIFGVSGLVLSGALGA